MLIRRIRLGRRALQSRSCVVGTPNHLRPGGSTCPSVSRCRCPLIFGRYRWGIKRLSGQRQLELRARERQRRQEQEELAELRRAEAAKIRAEEERRAAAERQKREALSAEAQRWEEARRIHSYVGWLRQRAADGHYSVESATLAAGGEGHESTYCWVTWALAVADELDPTAGRLARLKSDDKRGPG